MVALIREDLKCNRSCVQESSTVRTKNETVVKVKHFGPLCCPFWCVSARFRDASCAAKHERGAVVKVVLSMEHNLDRRSSLS